MRDRAVVFYGQGNDKSKIKWMVETVQQEYNCIIVSEIKEYEFITFKDYVQENNIQYLILAEKIETGYVDIMCSVLDSDIKAVLDAYSGEAIYNNNLNKSAFQKALSEKWERYMKQAKDVHNRVVIYHMSLDPIRSGCIGREVETMRVFAKKKGWEIVGEYVDLTNAKTKKTEFQKIMENACENEFDIVLLKNAYYISRRTNEFVKTRNELYEKDVAIYSMTEGWC